MAFKAAESPKTALVVLLGITANDDKIAGLRDFLGRNFDADVFVPELPFRRGLDRCAAWLARYLKDEGVFEAHDTTHFLAYIAGGFVLRLAAGDLPDQSVGRVVWVRGPIQERVPAAVVRRYTWPFIRLTQGRTVTDLAGRRLAGIPRTWSGDALSVAAAPRSTCEPKPSSVASAGTSIAWTSPAHVDGLEAPTFTHPSAVGLARQVMI